MATAERQEQLTLNEAFFRANLTSPNWTSWVAVFDDCVRAVGTLAYWLRPPYPGNPEGKDAYLLNMFTEPPYRGRGAATAILDLAIQAARERGVRKLILHATEAGRRRYLKAGFATSSAYMELSLGSRDA